MRTYSSCGSSGEPNTCPVNEKRNKGEKQENKRQDLTYKEEEIATELSIESSKPGSVPRVRLKAVVLRILKAIGSSSEYFVDNEGPLPFWFELVLLLLWEA